MDEASIVDHVPPFPFQQAENALRRFLVEVLFPLQDAKQDLKKILNDLERRQRVFGKACDSHADEEVARLGGLVMELSEKFKRGYDEISSIIRPGFPELRGMIQNIDIFAGMGKLRVDISLADFCNPLNTLRPETPNVFLAITSQNALSHKALKASYTLKRFPSDKIDDFYREMEAMERAKQFDGTQHPNVAEAEFSFSEGFDSSATHYLAMPFYPCDAATWFKKHILETKDRDAVLRALAEIAEGLHCLHCNRVIHGDLKPENIMFDSELSAGLPKLIDFNFSGVDQNTNAVLKVKTAALGATVGYTPPEFFDGQTTSRTPESDVYSLGKTFAAFLGNPEDSQGNPQSSGPTAREPQRKVKRLLGTLPYKRLTQLLKLMTHGSPERRISLGPDPSRSKGSVDAGSVLEYLKLLRSVPFYQCDSKSWFRKHILDTKDRDAVLRGLLEMAESLHGSHCKGFLYGDLTPDNILFDSESRSGRPKLIDPCPLDGQRTNRTPESDVLSLGNIYTVLLGKTRNPATSLDEDVPAMEMNQRDVKALFGNTVYKRLTELIDSMTHSSPDKRIRLGPAPGASKATSKGGCVIEFLALLKAGKADELQKCIVM